MKITINFKNLTKKDSAIAGGKGASLGEMTQANIPVPPGFVITAKTFEHFLQETDLKQEIDARLNEVDTEIIHTAQKASEHIRTAILAANIPSDIENKIIQSYNKLNAPWVAVRSSATAEDGAEHAWAGQLNSYLNTNKETLIENVKNCWASLFTPRAIFYRFEKNLHKEKISVAVVVQKMVESECAGIAFSVHPVTEDKNQMIIEAGWGLGEAVVSGEITPDSYVIEKDSKNILDININSQQKALYKNTTSGNRWKELPESKANKQILSEKEIKELTKKIIHIETHYDFPVDVEWARENNKFYIVQSRPITTLK